MVSLAMLIVLTVWSVVFLALVGLGAGLLALLGTRRPARSLLTTAFVGYAALIGFLQLWSLVLPLAPWGIVAVLALGAAGLFRCRPLQWRSRARTDWWFVAGGAAFAIWIANRAIGPCEFDSANYHLAVVRWLADVGTVPGLANLNPLYGHSSSSLLLPAMLEVGPGVARSSHFGNGLLVVMAFLLAWRGISEALADHSPLRPSATAATVWLYPLMVLGFKNGGLLVSSASTDTPVIATISAATITWARLFDRESTREVDHTGFHTLSVLALTALLPCLKGTAIILAALLWTYTAARAWRQRDLDPTRGSLRRAVFVSLLIGGGWMARQSILSGYPLYPSAWPRLAVDWRLPAEHMEGLFWWTRAYSRTPGDFDRMVDGTGFEWLEFWFRVEARAALHELIVPAALILALSALALFRKARSSPSGAPSSGFLLAVIALVFWFFTTPLTRYGQGLVWAAAALAAAALFSGRPLTLGKRRFIAISWLALGPALTTYFVVKYAPRGNAMASVYREFWTAGGSDLGFHPLFNVPTTSVQIPGGVDVIVPAAMPWQEPPPPWQFTVPWNSQLPSTAIVLPGLAARDSGDRLGGFRIPPQAEAWSHWAGPAVRAVQRHSGWTVGRLAVYFIVTPSQIRAALAGSE